MKRRSSYLICTMVYSLFCAATLQAGVKIELMNGEMISGDRIQWSGPSAILLESGSKETVLHQTVPLRKIKRLSIGESHYDQQTIQLAAANRGSVKPVAFISTHKKKRFSIPYSEYEPAASTLLPPIE